MGKIEALERESIIGVLSEGREVANELKRKLQPTTDSRRACHILVHNIVSSYENAIKLLDCMGLGTVFELPDSIQGSPLSEGSDPNSKNRAPNGKKRRKFPKWSEQVKVRSETGFEGQLDDGYNWRKYGQKGILGSNHPRAYYRCTHRNTQGCLATKQVQRADNNPSVFEVVYKGKHSCIQERPKPNKENIENLSVLKKEQEHIESLTVSTDPKPKLENQESVKTEDPFHSFSEMQFLAETSNIMGTNHSPRFLSMATPDSYFSMLPCLVNDFGDDFGESISNPSPVTNFSFGDLDFSIDQIDFSSHLLDTLDY